MTDAEKLARELDHDCCWCHGEGRNPKDPDLQCRTCNGTGIDIDAVDTIRAALDAERRRAFEEAATLVENRAAKYDSEVEKAPTGHGSLALGASTALHVIAGHIRALAEEGRK